ncbi:MAG: prepilin-type N-terminal cleavage/methylation domain-containing protein [Xanthomonadales bacterium]|nr:prepilin-type N-terminal cleavage/methylation domain-containing protein [Xanthomonadales bacterium]
MNFPRHGRGFTLLELLLAFVVFTLSFATVLEILSGSMRNTVRARHYSEAALTAQSLMDQVGLEIPLEAGFTANGEAGKYQWEIDILDYTGTGENEHSVELAELTGIALLQVDLAISWGEPPREQTRYFSTIKAVLSNLVAQP